ncbi:40S ribosomal protein S5-1 [Hordeum vulgare]|nr:40S ribosomal protein S5-1 [Hordeum vulgare]
MREGVLHIRDVEVPKKTGSMEARLEAMEQQLFKCQGMVERGLNANHMMITEFTNKHKIDANDIGKHLSRLYDKIDHLQAQIYDLQNQNCSSSLLLHFRPNGHEDREIPKAQVFWSAGHRLPAGRRGGHLSGRLGIPCRLERRRPPLQSRPGPASRTGEEAATRKPANQEG